MKSSILAKPSLNAEKDQILVYYCKLQRQFNATMVVTMNMSLIDQLFQERANFLVIGLTGRTGSGCTTVANLFGKDFISLSPPPPKQSDFCNDEERKYRIVYEYAKVNWPSNSNGKDQKFGFYHLKVSYLLAFYLIEHIDKDDIRDWLSHNKYEPFLEMAKEHISELSSYIRDSFFENTSSENSIDFIKITDSIEKYEKIDEKCKKLVELFFSENSKLEKFIKNLKELKDKDGKPYGVHQYVKLFQELGNKVREEDIFHLSERINKLIKYLRKRLKENKYALVIDAFRNPFEIFYFKERYSAFYLVSISTEDRERRDRLFKKNYREDEINSLDNTEYPKHYKGNKDGDEENKRKKSNKELLYSQNIEHCIQLSDIHIHNPNDETGSFNNIKKTIIKYVSLIFHPGLIPPTDQERVMQIAFNAKLNSGCISRQVGSAITNKDYTVKAIGWNNPAVGQTPCILRNAKNLIGKDDLNGFSEYENTNKDFLDKIKTHAIDEKSEKLIKNGINFSFCFKDIQNKIDCQKNQVHTRSLHAEEAAFLQISKDGGQGIEGGYLFVTSSPCELCSKKSMQIGITKIYYIDPYPGIAQMHILKSGNHQPELILFQGAIGRAYHQLFEPKLPYKDELEMRFENGSS